MNCRLVALTSLGIHPFFPCKIFYEKSDQTSYTLVVDQDSEYGELSIHLSQR
jgi:hypothetical protein